MSRSVIYCPQCSGTEGRHLPVTASDTPGGYSVIEFCPRDPRRDIEIVRAVQTCFACPSQWDAWTSDGRYLYLRFRHGVGTVTHYPSGHIIHPGGESTEIASFTARDGLDGVIDLTEFCRRAGIRLADNLELENL